MFLGRGFSGVGGQEKTHKFPPHSDDNSLLLFKFCFPTFAAMDLNLKSLSGIPPLPQTAGCPD